MELHLHFSQLPTAPQQGARERALLPQHVRLPPCLSGLTPWQQLAQLYSGSAGGSARMWDLATGQCASVAVCLS